MNTTMRDPLACDTHALNALLRGEMAAVETYTLVLGTSDDQEMITDLQKIRDEHSRAVRLLRDHVVRFGGNPVESPGPWSAFAAVGFAIVATQSMRISASDVCPAVACLAIVGPISAQRVTQHLAAWPGSSRLGGQGVVLVALALQFVMLLAGAAATLMAAVA